MKLRIQAQPPPPLFSNYIWNDLLPSGVQIDAYSVEDNGSLRFNVFVFNIQPGITIDYTTGDSERSS